MDVSDIFGEDVRDSSHLQIVSSEEEDVASQSPLRPLKISEIPHSEGNLSSLKDISPIKSSNGLNTPSRTDLSLKQMSNIHSSDKLDRQFRLDKTNSTNSDTQDIIDEINKIFESPDESGNCGELTGEGSEVLKDQGAKSNLFSDKVCLFKENGNEVDNKDNLFEKGKRIINRLKQVLVDEDSLNQKTTLTSSISLNTWTKIASNWSSKNNTEPCINNPNSVDDKSNGRPRRRLRKSNRTITGVQNLYSNYEDVFTDSSASSVDDNDDEYDPNEGLNPPPRRRIRPSISKVIRRSNDANSVNRSRANNKIKKSVKKTRIQSIESLATNEMNERASSIGLSSYLDEDPGGENQERMYCLKFAVLNSNKEAINDERLENVFIKATETIGNIAKKLGEMYNLDPREYEKIKIIIDGEPQSHSLQICDPELCVEDKMQIDVRFPSKEDAPKRREIKQTLKGEYNNEKLNKHTKGVGKRCVNVVGRNNKSRPQSAREPTTNKIILANDQDVLIID